MAASSLFTAAVAGEGVDRDWCTGECEVGGVALYFSIEASEHEISFATVIGRMGAAGVWGELAVVFV